MIEDILYTPEEVAGILKLSKYTIYEMVKRGDIPAHHVGRSIRISQSQLNLYLMGTRAAENVYEADIISEDGQQFAVVKNVRINVSTEMSGRVKISIPPESIILSKGSFISSARNQHQAIVVDIIHDERNAKVVLDMGIPLIALITCRSMLEMDITKGTELFAIFKTMSVVVF